MGENMTLNNNSRKLIVLLLLLLFASAPIVFASSNAQYSISAVFKDIDVRDDATVVISEDISYHITGDINGVYREIPISGLQSISDVKVETPGYYNTVEVINSSGKVTIKVWLYKDEAKTQKISSPADVKVRFNYHYNKALKVYNDIAELQYMSWGDGWDTSVDNLETNIHIPGSSSNTQFWNNPSSVVKSSQWNGDTLVTKYSKLDAKRNVEQRIIMPKEYIKSTDNADVIAKDAKSQIISDQEHYAFTQSISDNFAYISSILTVILMIIPAFIYTRYARGSSSLYKNTIQTQIPTDDSPLFVNIMLDGVVGEVNVNAYSATLLDLIDRGYFTIITSNDSDIVVKASSKDTGLLKQYELDVYDYVNKFAKEEGNISFRDISTYYGAFDSFMSAWEIDTSHEVSALDVRRYFDDRGHTYSIFYSAIAIFTSVVLLYLTCSVFKYGSFNMLAIILCILLIIEAVLFIVISNRHMGKWTSQGREFYDKWTNFKKYLKDYSLIMEKPPESVQVWGKFLVYATALGCAEEVTKNMKEYFKANNIHENELYDSPIIGLSYYGAFHYFYLSHGLANHHTSATDLSGSFGDIGGPGSGGFGGGGGGVF